MEYAGEGKKVQTVGLSTEIRSTEDGGRPENGLRYEDTLEFENGLRYETVLLFAGRK